MILKKRYRHLKQIWIVSKMAIFMQIDALQIDLHGFEPTIIISQKLKVMGVIYTSFSPEPLTIFR